ncbi:MAG: flagellar protein FlgN [Oscillospiraceae bacterium]|nr:flagellar protein FlgN [Oscillospiraceae bacterium]
MGGGGNVDEAVRKAIEDLLGILDKEGRMYASLLKASKKKAEVISKADVAELEKMTALERSFAERMAEADGLRGRTVRWIWGRLAREGEDASRDDVTVSELKGRVDDPTLKERLDAAHKGILDTILELRMMNELNERLLKNSLDYVDFSINVLTNAEEGGVGYDSKGKEISDGKKKPLMDVRL